MRCTTVHGPYHCTRELGHEGGCEADDIPPSRTFGPYTDAFRSRAYLRGALDVSSASMLDGIGGLLGVRRSNAEPDATYRERIWTESKPS